MKKGSNSFNSQPKSAGWDLIKKEVEKAIERIPIIKRWFSFKLKFPIENKVEFEFNIFHQLSVFITLFEKMIFESKIKYNYGANFPSSLVSIRICFFIDSSTSVFIESCFRSKIVSNA